MSPLKYSISPEVSFKGRFSCLEEPLFYTVSYSSSYLIYYVSLPFSFPISFFLHLSLTSIRFSLTLTILRLSISLPFLFFALCLTIMHFRFGHIVCVCFVTFFPRKYFSACPILHLSVLKNPCMCFHHFKFSKY